MSYFKLISTDILRNKLWDYFCSFENNNENKELPNVLHSSINTEICEHIKREKIIHHPIAVGGFGGVYNVKVLIKNNQESMYSINISINPNGGFEPSYIQCVMKANFNNMTFNCKFYNNFIFIEEPISEVVFSSFLNTIYDIGLCPFISKNLGFYGCENTLLQLAEKCKSDIFDLMGSYPKFFSATNTKNIIFQILYSLYVLKRNLGFVHYDLHLKNILYRSTDYIYKGSNLKTKKYFVLQTHHQNKFIILKNIDMFIKLNDFGQCGLFMNDSKSFFKKNLVLCSNYETISLGKGKNAIKNSIQSKSFRVTCDVMYILLNFWELLHKYYCVVDNNNDENLLKSQSTFSESIIMLRDFFYKFFNGAINIESFIREKKCELFNFQTYLKCLVGTRDVGLENSPTFNDCDEILNGLLRCCDKYITINNKEYYYFEDINFSDTEHVYFSIEPTIFEKKFNNFYNYITTKEEIFSEENILSKKIITPIDEQIVYKLQVETDHKLNIFRNKHIFNTITINNSLIDNINLNRKGSFIKQKYQTWFNNDVVKNEDIGKTLEILFFHIFNVTKLVPSVTFKKTLNEAHNINGEFLSISAQCFIVQGNINILTKHMISRKNISDPLGFFYIKNNPVNGTYLNYPSVYKEDMAVVYCVGKKIFIDKFSNFKSKHRLVPYLEKYINFYNNDIIENNYTCIAMTDSTDSHIYSQLGKYPVLINSNIINDNREDYEWAFETGPILIYDSKIIFDNAKLMEISKIKNVIVKTTPESKTPYKFFCESGEKNFCFNMRHSNKFIIHNVMFQTNKNEIGFILAEGRGFDSPGIDRIQLTYFLDFFDIKIAVALDGGFSACAKILDKFSHSTPESRSLPMVFSFNKKSNMQTKVNNTETYNMEIDNSMEID